LISLFKLKKLIISFEFVDKSDITLSMRVINISNLTRADDRRGLDFDLKMM